MFDDPHVSAPPTPSVGDFSQATVTWFDAEPSRLSAIRAHLRSTLAQWNLAATLAGPTEILLSELCTNVIRHTGSTRIGVRLECTAGGGLNVAVQQSHPDVPPPHAGALPAAGPDATNGRGLRIVDALATAWGTHRSNRITTTWFTMAPDEPPARAPERAAGAAPVEAPSSELVASLHASVHRSQLLLRITEALSSAQDRTSIAHAITRTLRGPLGAVFTGIALVGDDRRMRYVSLEPLSADTAERWADFPLDLDAPVAAAARTDAAYFHSDVAAAEAEFPGIAEHMRVAGAGAVAHLPLTARGTTFGTLAVSWSHERHFDADTRALLLIVAGYTAHALARN